MGRVFQTGSFAGAALRGLGVGQPNFRVSRAMGGTTSVGDIFLRVDARSIRRDRGINMGHPLLSEPVREMTADGGSTISKGDQISFGFSASGYDDWRSVTGSGDRRSPSPTDERRSTTGVLRSSLFGESDEHDTEPVPVNDYYDLIKRIPCYRDVASIADTFCSSRYADLNARSVYAAAAELRLIAGKYGEPCEDVMEALLAYSIHHRHFNSLDGAARAFKENPSRANEEILLDTMKKDWATYGMIIRLIDQLITYPINRREFLQRFADRTGHPIAQVFYAKALAAEAQNLKEARLTLFADKLINQTLVELDSVIEKIENWPERWRNSIADYAATIRSRDIGSVENQELPFLANGEPAVHICKLGSDPGDMIQLGSTGARFIYGNTGEDETGTYKVRCRDFYDGGELSIIPSNRGWAIRNKRGKKQLKGLTVQVNGDESKELLDDQVIYVPYNKRVVIKGDDIALELGFFSPMQIEHIKRLATVNRESQMDQTLQIPNHRALANAVAELQRSDIPFTVVWIDVDGLKYGNDHIITGTHDVGGNPQGDALMRGICNLLTKRMRRDLDALYRKQEGGDELVLIIKGRTGHEAIDIIRRLLEDVEGKEGRIVYIRRDGVGRSVIFPTVTMGVADSTMSRDYDDLEARAEADMKIAKDVHKRRGGVWYKGQEVIPNLRYPMPQTYFEEDGALMERYVRFKSWCRVHLMGATGSGRVKLTEISGKLVSIHSLLVREARVEDAIPLIETLEAEMNNYHHEMNLDRMEDNQIAGLQIIDRLTIAREIRKLATQFEIDMMPILARLLSESGDDKPPDEHIFRRALADAERYKTILSIPLLQRDKSQEEYVTAYDSIILNAEHMLDTFIISVRAAIEEKDPSVSRQSLEQTFQMMDGAAMRRELEAERERRKK